MYKICWIYPTCNRCWENRDRRYMMKFFLQLHSVKRYMIKIWGKLENNGNKKKRIPRCIDYKFQWSSSNPLRPSVLSLYEFQNNGIDRTNAAVSDRKLCYLCYLYGKIMSSCALSLTIIHFWHYGLKRCSTNKKIDCEFWACQCSKIPLTVLVLLYSYEYEVWGGRKCMFKKIEGYEKIWLCTSFFSTIGQKRLVRLRVWNMTYLKVWTRGTSTRGFKRGHEYKYKTRGKIF